MHKYGFVYIWRDRKHSRFYIGSHWGNVNDGYICSSSWMKKAYNLRPEDFKRKILKTGFDNKKQMYLEEQMFLSRIKPEEVGKKYYNLRVDIPNPWYQHEDKVKTVGQKISKSLTGRKNKPTSEETKLKISQAKKGKTTFSEEHREKLRAAKLGRKLSQDHKNKISNSLKQRSNK